MGNWDRKIGEGYMYETTYGAPGLLAQDQGEESVAWKPQTFKLYRNVCRFQLSQTLPFVLGDARWSFEAYRRMHQPAPRLDGLDVEGLSALLYYTYGFSRHDTGPGAVWPFHRLVPSARCLFPTELYIWIPKIGDIPDGLYHYDALHHQLAALRLGDYRSEISRISGTELDGARCVLLVSSLFWKTAFRYRNYSYRLCTQEAGMVVGNALMVGGTLGMQGHVHYQFLDRPINRLMGFVPSEESLFAVIPMYSWRRDGERGVRRPRVVADQNEFLDEIESIMPTYIKDSGFNTSHLYGMVTKLDQNSFLESTSEFAVSPPDSGAPCCAPHRTETLPPVLTEPDCVELAGTLRSRESGNVSFNPTAKQIGDSVFWRILRYAMSPHVCDLRRDRSEPSLRLYAVVNNIQNVPQGVYKLCSRCGALRVIERRSVSMLLQEVMYKPSNINAHSSNLVLYLAGDYTVTSNVFGNRAYRILNMEAGIVAQRVCVMAAASGLSARVSNRYDPSRVKALLELVDSPLMPIFQIVIGRNKPGVQYGLSIKF